MDNYIDAFFQNLNPVVNVVGMIVFCVAAWKVYFGIWGFIDKGITFGLDQVIAEPTTSMTQSEISQYRSLVRLMGTDDEKASLLSLSDAQLVEVVAPYLTSMRESKRSIKKSVTSVGAIFFILSKFPKVNIGIGLFSIAAGALTSCLVMALLQLPFYLGGVVFQFFADHHRLIFYVCLGLFLVNKIRKTILQYANRQKR